MTWRAAMREALYGDDGFYRRGERPAAHFRTSVHVSPAFAEAILRLLDEVDRALGRPDPLDVVDIGAGEGELLTTLVKAAPRDLAARLRPCAVEVAPRPESCPITWRPMMPEGITGVVIANEWLDNVPVDVAELDRSGPRLVEVDVRTGAERLGAPPPDEELAWLRTWWPLRTVGDRAELGGERDAAWAEVVVRLARGVAIAIDYSHNREDRPAAGTLTGYREGAAVVPVPDGSCDITAHVALDACGSTGAGAGAEASLLTTQRAALRALGVSGTRPPLALAGSDPRGYLTALARASEEGELIGPDGLGGFGWLAQAVRCRLPSLAAPPGRG